MVVAMAVDQSDAVPVCPTTLLLENNLIWKLFNNANHPFNLQLFSRSSKVRIFMQSPAQVHHFRVSRTKTKYIFRPSTF